MTSGANGGNAGCCPSLSGGFTQSYVNRHAIDQLATFELHRNKSGFTGVHCDPGSCVVCVRPLPPTPTSCSDAGPTHYRLYFDTDASGDWPAEMLSAPELLQNVRGSGGAECSDGSGGCFYMANDGFQYRGLQGSLGCDLAPSFDGQLPYWQLALKQLPATAPCQWHIALIGHMKPNGGVSSSSATYSNTADRSSGAADTNCFSSPPVSNYPMEPFRLQRTGFNNDNGTTGEPPTSVLVVPV
ncbi:hypothetical protein KOR42_48220 [Thalassoglobus neptunius]|uniref:Uncharacterized protein n=1 Tax=Thalassoglobus neptunius TaxID=1938619 RepID=A0A5C5VUZ3_9PLAN|nr:hypothetical protein [Thalassoglobus neptunius]TWT41469.1 hypothetical protein KOR42_48220 [Thalassoglobus neptunius]